MQTQKWVNLGLLVVSAILFFFFSQLVGAIWDVSRLPMPEEWPVQPPYMVSFVLAGMTGIFVRRHLVANSFLNDVVLELSRVTWPQRKETVASAGVVAVLIAIAALLMLVIDTIWGTVIRGVVAL